MECCHTQGVIHRDLKLENVMFETMARKKIKVVDFGIAGMCRGDEAEKNDYATVRYMTPEMINTRNSTAAPSMDVWAIGIMMYCMLFNRLPFNGETKDDIKK
jgi:serine/threonine protein kinase